MDDLISRQDVINKFEPWLKVEGYSEGELNMLKAILYELTVMPSAQPEPLPLEDEYVGAHCIKVCPVCYTPWTRPRTSEYLKKTKYPFCPCGQMIKWGDNDE